MKPILVENIRQVIAPLTVDQIKEFFLNKELLFVVDYVNSKIKGKVFLTYISNLDLPAEISLDGCTKEQKLSLLRDYMEVRNVTGCRRLALAACAVLLHSRGVPINDYPLEFSPDELTEFAATYPELLGRWLTFLDSMILFSMISVQIVSTDEAGQDEGAEGSAFEEAFPGIFKDYDIIDDPLYVGTNIINLFSIPMFLEKYFSVPTQPAKYFKHQFDEYSFKGKRLFYYFATPQNTFFAFLLGIVTNKITMQQMIEVFDKNG